MIVRLEFTNFFNHAVVCHRLFDAVNEPCVFAIVRFCVYHLREVKQPALFLFVFGDFGERTVVVAMSYLALSLLTRESKQLSSYSVVRFEDICPGRLATDGCIPAGQ
jgi:hypothetical protein